MGITYTALGPGTFPDVSYDGADQYVVWFDNAATIQILKNGVSIGSHPIGGGLAFTRIDGRGVIFRDNTQGYYWADLLQPFSTRVLLGPMSGNDPGVLNATYLAWQTTAFSLRRQLRAGGAVTALGAGRPTGISYLTAAGGIVLVDSDRYYPSPASYSILRPDRDLQFGYVVGEDPTAGARVIGATEVVLWPGTVTNTPKIATSPAGEIAVVTWGPNGVRLAVLTADVVLPPPGGGGGGGGGTGGGSTAGSGVGTPSTSKTDEAAALTAARAPRPIYPHVDAAKAAHFETGMSLQLLWTKVHEIEQGVVGSGATSITSQLAAITTRMAKFSTDQTAALARLTQAEAPSPALTSLPGGGTGGGGGGSGGGGGGGGGAPNHLDVVVAARAYYDAYAGVERAGLIVNKVAWDLKNEGFGTVYKPSGTNWRERSIDIVMRASDGATWDILTDAEGTAGAQWSRTGPTGFGDLANWRASVDPATLP